MTSHLSQSQYQVRFDWGSEGADAVAADADVVIVVDVLGSDPLEMSPEHPAVVLAGGLRDAKAVASWVLARQDAMGRRCVIAVIASGGRRADGSTRFAVEDLLGAGSVIEELAQLGIDYYSPEAAAAAAAFTGLGNAIGHLVSASGSGRELVADGRKDEVSFASKRNVSDEVTILREFDPRA